MPVLSRHSTLNRAMIVSQDWIAASQNTADRHRLPPCGASQVMSLSSQIRRDPRSNSEAVWLDPFVLGWWADDGLLMQTV